MHAAILFSIAYHPLNCKMERDGKKHTVEWDYQKQKEKTLKEKKKKTETQDHQPKCYEKGK